VNKSYPPRHAPVLVEESVDPNMSIDEVLALLRRLSTNTHEACLEAFAMADGLACQVRLVPRDDVAPEFLRMQARAFTRMPPQGGEH
jgi:hypothetical protein